VTLPIDPSVASAASEWSIPSISDATTEGAGAGAVQGAGKGSGFGSMLADQLGKLEATQNEAADAAQALATGQATDPEAVVMAVERARLSMQLASTLRNKAVEAVNDVFHTQV
jgi:flagellar hook-basal body complex protein FliE